MIRRRQLHHRDRCAITGIGATDVIHASRDFSDLSACGTQARRRAIADAGLRPTDIDGIVRCDMDLVRPYSLADVARASKNLHVLGRHQAPAASAPPAMIGLAMGAVLSRPGHDRARASARSTAARAALRAVARPHASEVVGGAGKLRRVLPARTACMAPGPDLRADGPAAHDRVRHHARAAWRPSPSPAASTPTPTRHAQMGGKALTIDDYLASPDDLLDPLRLFDYCLESDGACAVVITSAERAHGPAQAARADPRRGRRRAAPDHAGRG